MLHCVGPSPHDGRCASENAVVKLSSLHVNRMIAEIKSERLIAMNWQEVKIVDRVAFVIPGEFRPVYLARTPIREQRR